MQKPHTTVERSFRTLQELVRKDGPYRTGKAARIARSTLQRFVDKHGKPSTRTLDAIAKHFGYRFEMKKTPANHAR